MKWITAEQATEITGLKRKSLDKRAERGKIQKRGRGKNSEYLLEPGAVHVAPRKRGTPAKVGPHSSGRGAYHAELDYDARVIRAHLPFLTDVLCVSFDDDIELFRRYSRDGGNQTIKAIAVDLGLEPNILRGYMRARGLEHASTLWPEHEMASLSDSELLKSAEAVRASNVAKRLREKDAREQAKKAAQFGKLSEYITEVAEATREVLQRSTVPPIDLAPSTCSESVHWIAPETDSHLDATGSNGEGYDHQRKILRETRAKLIARCLRNGSPASWTWWVGSDWGNSDNAQSTTTKGTPQRDSLPVPMRAAGLVAAAIEAVDTYLSTLGPDGVMYLVRVPGNHDWVAAHWLFECLRIKYESNPKVRLVEDIGGRAYVRLGAALIINAHGHINSLDPRTLRNMAFCEVPDMLAGARRIHVIRGDKHTAQNVDSKGGSGKDIGLAAMSPQSTWASERFIHQPRLHALGVTECGAMPYDITAGGR